MIKPATCVNSFQGEPFNETKQRLSEFTKIKGKQLDKIKFALVSRPQYSRPEYIDDSKWHVRIRRCFPLTDVQTTSCGT
jgi:hypothetical protein